MIEIEVGSSRKFDVGLDFISGLVDWIFIIRKGRLVDAPAVPE
jgi:hypothetical protein